MRIKTSPVENPHFVSDEILKDWNVVAFRAPRNGEHFADFSGHLSRVDLAAEEFRNAGGVFVYGDPINEPRAILERAPYSGRKVEREPHNSLFGPDWELTGEYRPPTIGEFFVRADGTEVLMAHVGHAHVRRNLSRYIVRQTAAHIEKRTFEKALKLLNEVAPPMIKTTWPGGGLGETVRPPLGLKPKDVHDRQRAEEIADAIGRYVKAWKVIPSEWFDELIALAAKYPEVNTGTDKAVVEFSACMKAEVLPKKHVEFIACMEAIRVEDFGNRVIHYTHLIQRPGDALGLENVKYFKIIRKWGAPFCYGGETCQEVIITPCNSVGE